METSKTERLLKAIYAYSEEQNNKMKLWKDLGLFIESPFFNKSKQLVDLFECLEKHLKKKPIAYPSKEQIHKYLIKKGHTKFKLAKVSDISSNLYLLIEEYLATITFDAQEALKLSYKLEWLQLFKLDKHLQGHQKNVNRVLSIKKDTESSAPLNRYILSNKIVAIKKPEDRLPELIDSNTYLDQYYLREQGRLLCIKLSYQAVKDVKRLEKKRDYFLTYCKEFELENFPIASLYYKLLLVYAAPRSKDLLEEYLEYLHQVQDYFSSYEIHRLYDYLVNFYIRRIKIFNQFELRPRLYNTYKDAYENGFMRINVRHYKNFVVLGASVGDIEWVTAFNEKYKSEFSKVYYDLNRAYIAFYQQDYATLKQIIEKELGSNPDKVFRIGKRMLALKLYYLIDDIDGIENAIRSFEEFLRNQNEEKMINEMKDAHGLFLEYFKRIYKGQSNPNIDLPVDELLKEISDSSKVIADKFWLLDILNKIGKKKVAIG